MLYSIQNKNKCYKRQKIYKNPIQKNTINDIIVKEKKP